MADKSSERGRVRREVIVAIALVVAIISLWRGIWGLSDLYLFQDNVVLSYFASIVIGLAILSFAHYGLKQVHLI
jgi:hypothetical protein